jgi:hypothetical protein
MKLAELLQRYLYIPVLVAQTTCRQRLTTIKPAQPLKPQHLSGLQTALPSYHARNWDSLGSLIFLLDSFRVRSYNVLQAVTERTSIYNDNVRLWFESYFLTRRTVLIILSVGLCNYPIQRAVHNPSVMLACVWIFATHSFCFLCDSKPSFLRYCWLL